MLLFAYQALPQSTPPDLHLARIISAPPSRSPSPLSLTPQDSDPSAGDLHQESDSSDSRSECSEPNSPSIMTLSKVRDNLASKRFLYDDEKALERCGQAIKEKALGIMTSQRHSPTSRDNAPSLKEAIKRFSSSTERTLVHNVWCILKQKSRHVIDEASPKNDDKTMEWVKRAWVMDFLECVLEADLSKDCIPDTSHTVSSRLNDGCNKH